DGIRDGHVTGVQTCALPICQSSRPVWGSTATRCLAAKMSMDSLPSEWNSTGVAYPVGLVPFNQTRRPVRRSKALPAAPAFRMRRSEERRVGKECGGGGWREG